MLGVLHLLAQVLGYLAFAMLLPAVIGLVGKDPVGAETFLLVAGLTGFVAGAIFFALRGRQWHLGRVSAFTLVLAVWTVPPFIAAIPFMAGTRLGYVEALFEAVSGYTTTGATVFRSLDLLGPATIFWRAELQWLGGLLTLIAIVTVLAPTSIGGLTSRGAALLGPVGEGTIGRSSAAVRLIAVIYSAATVLCLGLLVLAGVPAFEAVCLAFSTVSTGGFMPMDGGFENYRNPLAEIVVMLFMVVGATSIVWHRMIMQGRWAMLAIHRESYWVIGTALAIGVVYAVILAGQGGPFGDSAVDFLRQGLFDGISLVSTTGFETRPGALATLPAAVAAALAIVGAGTMSTAGGIKFYRLGGMFVQSMHELKRLVYPHSVRSTHFGSQPYDIGLMKAIWASSIVALAFVAAATLLLTLNHPSFHGGALAAISAFSNIGPLYAAEWDGSDAWPGYADFDGFSMAVLAFTMIVGRIEAIALFSLASLAFWRS